MVHQSPFSPSAREFLHQHLLHQSKTEAEGYRYLLAVTWMGPGFHEQFHLLGMDATFLQESGRSIVQSDWGNKTPKVQKILGKGRISKHPGACHTLTGCVKHVSKSGALCPLPRWKMGLWRSNHTTECCENKNKTKKYILLHSFISVKGKQPRVQCSQTNKRCNCPDLGWWVFSTLLLCFLREGFSSLPQARSPGHGAAAAARAAKPNPALVQLHQSSQPHRRD